ncbi:MAG: BTAD domain-containing putative transcriptional regulator [Longimicrobiaceae bacterium]
MKFSLKLFGGASLTGQSGAVGGPATQRHRLALLALLATSHPCALQREKLMVRLWPERDSKHARKLLNQAGHALRKTLGGEVILSAGDELRFNPRVVQCDVIAFEEALATGDAERAVELYAGPFLDGFFLSQAPEFERWAEGERERFRRACCKALEGLAEAATARDDSSSAVEWWRRLAAEEPYNARVTLRLMKALEAGGDRAGALQQARVHTLLLQEEFEAEPDPQVTALAERLRTEPAVRIEPDRERPGEEGNGAADPQPVALPLRLDSIAVPSASASVTEADNDAAAATEPRSPAGIPTPMPRWNFRLRFRWLALALLGFGGLAVLLTASLLRRTGSPTLHPQRLVVAPFENRTGDPALDPVGSMAADWITHGLSRTAIVDVVTRQAALVSANRVRAAASETPGLDPIRALSEETGAGLVISGAYYLNGDSLHFQAQITDARHSTTLWAVEPIAAGVSAPMPAIELLRQRTLAALAPVLDTRLAAHARLASQPPTYEAYRAYAEGMEIFIESRWRESIEHFERALALDSTYLLPRLLIAIAYANLGANAVADSIGRELNESRERLGPYDRALLDLMMSWLGDDRAAMYEAAKRAAALAPGSLPHVQWGIEAARLNRPREAIEILSQIDPTRGEVRGWAFYWRYLTQAHHMLGNHRRELQEARRARALDPDDPVYLLFEAQALAALGRLGEVEEVVNARLSLSEQKYPHPGQLMLWVADELRVHGHTDAARKLYTRAIGWYRARPAEEQERYRAQIGHAHRFAEEWREARALFEQLAAEEPENIAYQGALGVLAARRGDRVEAERIAAWLAARREPYLWGNHSYWRACIAVQLGRKAEAVTLLREAFGQGMWYTRQASWPWLHLHTDPCLDPLRDYRPFRELMRPKG